MPFKDLHEGILELFTEHGYGIDYLSTQGLTTCQLVKPVQRRYHPVKVGCRFCLEEFTAVSELGFHFGAFHAKINAQLVTATRVAAAGYANSANIANGRMTQNRIRYRIGRLRLKIDTLERALADTRTALTEALHSLERSSQR
jgi:hypothetical protein